MVEDFFRESKRPALIIDRIDFLINNHGFNEFIRFFYSLSDLAMSSDSFLGLVINPRTLTRQELSILEQEVNAISSSEAPRPAMEDDVMEIITFVGYSNKKVSFKDVTKKFMITKTTTRRRINKLVDMDLVHISKNGRNKIVRLSDLGKSYLFA